MAAIYTLDSETIIEGLQGCNTCDEALVVARRVAAERGEGVLLADDDGLWRVHPDGACEPELDETAVRALRTEAAMRGDHGMVAICDLALAGDVEAIAECMQVIAEAEALED